MRLRQWLKTLDWPKLPDWVRRHETIELFVSSLAVLIACYSVWFSIYSFRKQFELDMRPFVGITGVEREATDAETLITVAVKNNGKLPAKLDEFHAEWWISEGPNRLAGAAQRLQNQFVFPSAEFKFSIPFRGVLQERYLARGKEEYVLNIKYLIRYSSTQINHSFNFEQVIAVNNAGEISTESTNGN